MVDSKRNVILILSLVADSNNQAVARQVASQAQSVAGAGSKGYEELRSVADKVQKQITEINQVQSDLRLDIDRSEHGKRLALAEKNQSRLIALEEKKQELEEKKAEERSRMRANLEQRRQDVLEKKRLKAAQDFQKKLDELEKSRVDNMQRSNEAAVAAVQGLADIAQGMAKLGILSEDNLQKFMRHFTMIQEWMRVFKGATALIWKGREALIALSAATNAQTTANNLMAASGARAAAAQGVAGASSGVATGGSAISGAAILSGMVAKVAGVAAVFLALSEGAKYLGRSFGDTDENAESLIGAIQSWHKAVTDAENSQKRLTEAKERTRRLQDELRTFESRTSLKYDLRRQDQDANNRRVSSHAVAGGETAQQRANRHIEEARTGVALANLNIKDRQMLSQRRLNSGGILYHSDVLDIKVLKDKEEAQGRLLDAEHERLAVIREQNKTLDEQIKRDRERLISLKKIQKADEASLRAQLGRMNPTLQRLTIKVGKKIKSGESLNQRDIAILEKARIGKKYIDEYYANRGAGVAGADIYAQVFGDKENRNEINNTERQISNDEKKRLAGSLAEDAASQGVRVASNQYQRDARQRILVEGDRNELKDGFLKIQQDAARQLRKIASEASDSIQQQAMANIDSIKMMQQSVIQGYADMKKQIDQFEQMKNSYNPGKLA